MRLSALFSLYHVLTSVWACLTELELQGGHHVARDEPWPHDMPIGQGDRFADGELVPRGVGINDAPASFDAIMNTQEMRSALESLAREFPGAVELFDAPHKTYDGATVFGAKVAGTASQSQFQSSSPAAASGSSNTGYGAFIEGQIHARERGSGDFIVYFVSDLLHAQREGTGLQYGNVSYTHDEVLAALGVGIVAVPLVNPDGTAYDQATSSCWRKNRNRTSAIEGDPLSIGIDLNRNFDVAWDFQRLLSPEAEGPASTDPSSTEFYGTAPLSEAETRNVAWVLEAFPDVGWFADVHSILGAVIHGWTHDDIQSDDPAQNWRNPAYDGQRGIIDGPNGEYGEYMPRSDRDQLGRLTSAMASAMNDTLGNVFRSGHGAELLTFAAVGSSIDHAYSRHILDCKKKKVFGVGLEFGRYDEFDDKLNRDCPFYPHTERYRNDMIEVCAGLMEFILEAAWSGH